MKNFPDLPPIWTLIAVTLIVLLDWLFPDFAFDFQNRWIATVLMAAGVGLILWSALWFIRKKTTIEPHHVPTVLLVEGPYRVSRNPIYTGMVIFCFGVVIYAGNLLGILPALGLIWVLHTRFVMPEEKGLLEAFGKEAEAYIAKTRRW